MATKSITGPRSVALIGPYSSGKTTLLENLLYSAGAISRKGTIKEGNTVGDSSLEAKSRKMSVEISPVIYEFLGDSFSVLDCPGKHCFELRVSGLLLQPLRPTISRNCLNHCPNSG